MCIFDLLPHLNKVSTSNVNDTIPRAVTSGEGTSLRIWSFKICTAPHYKNWRPLMKSGPVAPKGCTGLTKLIQRCPTRTTDNLPNSIVMKRDPLFLPVLQLNSLCVSALIISEKNLTIGHFNYSYPRLLGKLR